MKYEVFAHDGVKDRWGSKRFVRGEHHATFTKLIDATAFAHDYIRTHPRPWPEGEVRIEKKTRAGFSVAERWLARSTPSGAVWVKVILDLSAPARKNPGGTRFAECVRKVERSAAERGYPLKSARGVCAAIGRAKYGPEKFAKMSAAGRKRARGNPTAAIRSWHRKGATLIVHDLDIDDAVRERGSLRAPGYVLRVHDAEGTFALHGASFKKGRGAAGRWKLEKVSGRAATGIANLATGKHKLNESSRALPLHRREDLSMLMDWLRHEAQEHGKLPPPRARNNPGCGCGG